MAIDKSMFILIVNRISYSVPFAQLEFRGL